MWAGIQLFGSVVLFAERKSDIGFGRRTADSQNGYGRTNTVAFVAAGDFAAYHDYIF